MAYESLQGKLADVVSVNGNGRYSDWRSGGGGTALLEDQKTGRRVLLVENRHRNGHYTEIDSLPANLDEIRIRQARVKLNVPSVPKLVVENAILELTTDSAPDLDIRNGSEVTLA
ncbi:hypothetical protein, partial [Marinobacter xestospongiae]